MGELVKQIVKLFSEDPSAPSVTVSWLPDRQAYYASVVRYAERFGQGKYVVWSCSGPNLDECLQYLKGCADAVSSD